MSQEEQINTPETFSNDEEQVQILNELYQNLEIYAQVIHRSFELGQIQCVIEGASKLIDILRTPKLTPKNYYQIYHSVSTVLLTIFQNLQDEERFSNQKVAELYETVQYLPGVMQRLYLMITIAPELGRRKIVRVVDILDDLSDMARAAQDPIRALFLRHYLLSIFKQYLPDSNEQQTDRSLDFLLTNFAQMNRMWVRIEDIMGSDERKEQRADFSVLIGTNIQRISALNGITIEKYSNVILPFIAKHVELCEDALAQEFILRSIIHAFPEDFHIATVDHLFGVFAKVEQGVKILDIVNQLLERFLQYIGHLIDPTKSSAVFVTIAKNIEELFNAEGHLSLTSKFETLQRLLRFALKINTNDVKNVKNLMKFTDFHIDLAIGEESLKSAESSEQLKKFLEVPLTVFTSAEYLYKIEYLPVLVNRLIPKDRFYVANLICDLFLSSQTKVTNSEELTFYIKSTASLVRENDGSSCFFSIIHLIDGGDDEKTVQLLKEMDEQLDDMTKISAEKFVLPFSLHLLQIYAMKNIQNAFHLIIQFCKKNDESFPSKTTIVYTELLKLSIERNDKELQETVFQNILNNIPHIERQTELYHIIELICNLFERLMIDNVERAFPVINEATNSIIQLQRKIITMCDFVLLVWRKTKDSHKTLEQLEATLQAILNKNDEIGVSLNAFYILLDTTVFLLDEKCELPEDWLIKLLSLISVRHKEILATGKKLDAVVSTNGKLFYINLAHYIQDRDFIKD